VRRWCPPPARLQGHRVDAAALVADRYVWYTLGSDDDAESIVLDLEAWPSVRHVGLRGRAIPLLGATSATVVRLEQGEGIIGHGPLGNALARRLRLKSFPATRITVTPLGNGLLGFGEARALAELGAGGVPVSVNAGTEGVAVAYLREDGMFRAFGLKDVLRTDALDVATSTAAGCFLVRRRRGANAHLYGGRVDDWEVHGGLDAPVPPSTVFVRDAASRFVRAIAWEEDGLLIFDPTDSVPAWSLQVEMDARLDLTLFSGPFLCAFGSEAQSVEALVAVHDHIAGRSWQLAADALDRLHVASMPPAVAQHHHHLRALAALWLGDLPVARAAVRAARARDGGCNLDGVIALLDALDGKPAGILGAYVERLLRADACLTHGDAKAARDTLDCAHTWRDLEQQGLVRLAAAWLQLTPETPAERFRKRMALAAVCEGWRNGVPIPPLTWTAERVREVVEAARRELA